MLNELNDAIAASGGDWVKLNEAGQQVTGALVDAEVRPRMYDGSQVVSKAGNPRKVWTLTLDVPGRGAVKADADEGGQAKIRAAAAKLGRNLAAGDVVAIVVTESSVQGKSGAEWDVTISAGKPVADDDAPPF